MGQEQHSYFAKTLEKGIRILALFDEDNPSWYLSEISARLNINQTSIYRLVNTFVELGYLKKDRQSKSIRLGPMAVALGNQLLHGFDLNRLIEPLVDEYHERYGVSIDVSLMQSHTLVQVYNRQSAGTLTYRQESVSEQLYCTGTGKSVLAFLPPAELTVLNRRQSFAQRTAQTITDAAAFADELRMIRERGYALNNEEYIKGLIAIAAPLLSRISRTPLGAVSMTTTTLDQSLAQFERDYASILCELALKLSEVIPDI